MKRFFIGWMVHTLAVLLAAHVVTGIHYDSVGGLLAASLTLGILNALLRPLLILLSLPLVVFTLGLFALVINALLLLFVGWLIESFDVHGFWSAFWGGLIISIASWILNAFLGVDGASRPPLGNPKKNQANGPIIDV